MFVKIYIFNGNLSSMFVCQIFHTDIADYAHLISKYTYLASPLFGYACWLGSKRGLVLASSRLLHFNCKLYSNAGGSSNSQLRSSSIVGQFKLQIYKQYKCVQYDRFRCKLFVWECEREVPRMLTLFFFAFIHVLSCFALCLSTLAAWRHR